MAKNLLVATFGNQWLILPELFGFTNYGQTKVYLNRSDSARIQQERAEFGIEPVEDIWLVSTDDNETRKAIEKARIWLSRTNPGAVLQTAVLADISDLNNAEQSRQMRDLVFRAVLKAKEAADGGRVYLSLAGGRKTMSGDMQEAGNVFGCHAMLHVLSRKARLNDYDPAVFTSLDSEDADAVSPVAVFDYRPQAAFLFGDATIHAEDYPIVLGNPGDGNGGRNQPSTALADKIQELSKRAGIVLSNHSALMDEHGETFHALMGLHPEVVQRLQRERIGCNPDFEARELAWIHSFPKAELHCHFGGILTAAEMIQVALAETERVSALERENARFRDWIAELGHLRCNRNWEELRRRFSDKKGFRQPVDGVPEPLAVCGFLRLFEHDVDSLENLIYGDNLDPAHFVGIDISPYEALGDLQGSALMQSEVCIREACRCLKKRCQESNIAYCEVRCSPLNYTKGGLRPEGVVHILMDELRPNQTSQFSLIFIASRHGKKEIVRETVELAKGLLTERPPQGWSKQELNDFRAMFVGFDLAGSEGSANASDFKVEFDPLLRRCMKMTIHAGETEPAESIWDAVYGLNADRIGHGLTLVENTELLLKFLDRNIAIEMCPSSNFQIRGYRDRWIQSTAQRPWYPLSEYLRRGLRVSINTDDPGISRTTLDNEYLKAARMTDNGLSKWDVLQLIYNGFASSFAVYSQRRKLLNKTGQDILDIIEAEERTRHEV